MFSFTFKLICSFWKVKVFSWEPRFLSTSPIMANSKWEYVKSFETEDALLPNCWAVARIDGRGFHKLAKIHKWTRPNDERALKLMNTAAKSVMYEYNDIILAYGQSDEYSFVFRREAEIFQRRSSKIITTLVSQFASAYVFYWNKYFQEVTLHYPPSFDGRMVLYPTDKNLRDYLSWRQADCHINNLYNTTFWSLVLKGGLTNNDAEKRLLGTFSADKNEILFSEFGINYNNEPELFRKGTVLVQKEKSLAAQLKSNREKQPTKTKESKLKSEIERLSLIDNYFIELNCDMIGDKFWEEYLYLLNGSDPLTQLQKTDKIKITL